MQRYSFDSEYVEALRAGDSEVQQHFATYFRELLLIKVRRRVASRETADDLIQETFVRVLTSIRGGGLRSAQSLGAYVDSVCNNVLLEHYRANKRTSSLEEDDAPVPIDERFSPEDVVASRESQQQVAVVLKELRPKDRKLLRQVFLEEEDKDKVCSDLGVDREHLRVLLHRAKNRFRTLLESKTKRSISALAN